MDEENNELEDLTTSGSDTFEENNVKSLDENINEEKGDAKEESKDEVNGLPEEVKEEKQEEVKEKKKKGIVLPIILVLLLLIGAGLAYYFLFYNKITVTFKDGDAVVNTVTLKKNEKVSFPKVEKEGYVLDGWYYNDEKIDENKTFDKNSTVVAKWNTKENTMTISFDTDGGDPLEDQVIPCDTELNLPTPTKSGYKFLDWRDRNEIVISNETKLVCQDIHLKANWEKEEEKKEEPPKEDDKKDEPKKEYTCPSGYTLNGTKCTLTKDANTKCEGQSVHEYNGDCVTVNNTARKTGDYSCPELDIHVGSYAGKEKGELVQAGTYFCYYHSLPYNTQSQCESLSGQFGNFVWRATNNTCYVVRKNATMSCDNLEGYVYIGNPNDTFSDVHGLNGGCFPKVEKTKYCLDDFTLQDGKCVKTIDATEK